MQDDTKVLLQECSKGCKMAIESLDQIMEFVDDAKLCKLIDNSKDKHREIEADVANLLAGIGQEDAEPGKMVSAFSWMTTEVKMMLNENNNQAVKIIMNGCNMGIQTISEHMNQCRDADEKSRSLADKLIKEEERLMKELKAYL